MTLDALQHELRVAWRQVRRRPAGAAAALFALVDGVVFRPLPVRDESSIALLRGCAWPRSESVSVRSVPRRGAMAARPAVRYPPI
jgi:hypothetical protein